VCFKEAFNLPHRKRILGITRSSFKGYTSSQYMHKATKVKQDYEVQLLQYSPTTEALSYQ